MGIGTILGQAWFSLTVPKFSGGTICPLVQHPRLPLGPSAEDLALSHNTDPGDLCKDSFHNLSNVPISSYINSPTTVRGASVRNHSKCEKHYWARQTLLYRCDGKPGSCCPLQVRGVGPWQIFLPRDREGGKVRGGECWAQHPLEPSVLGHTSSCRLLSLQQHCLAGGHHNHAFLALF